MNSPNINFISKFLTNSDNATSLYSLTFRDLAALATYDVKQELVETFARIYNSSDAFDLGRPPSVGNKSYESDALENIVGVIAGMQSSARERAEAVHNTWAHTYLSWRLAGKASDRDSLLVPFDALPAYEKKKRYFAAELIPLIVASDELNPVQERLFASAALDLAAYHVAYELVQDMYDDIPDAHELVEINDSLFNSPSTLY